MTDLTRRSFPLAAIHARYQLMFTMATGRIAGVVSSTLIVDFVDREASRVVWRGVGQSTYHGPGENIVADDMTLERAKDAVEDVMAGFPPK